MKIYKTASCKEFERLSSAMTDDRTIVHKSDTLCIWTGQLDSYDKVAVRRRGYEVGVGKYIGGTIINFAGDLSVCRITWGKSDYGERITTATLDWLLALGLNAVRDNNDILVDGKKVYSFAAALTLTGWEQTVIHYSVNMDVEIVKEICRKPLLKVPGALSCYGITAEIIETAIFDDWRS